MSSDKLDYWGSEQSGACMSATVAMQQDQLAVCRSSAVFGIQLDFGDLIDGQFAIPGLCCGVGALRDHLLIQL